MDWQGPGGPPRPPGGADYTVEQAIEDIVILESLSGQKPAAIKVEAGEANTTRLKTYLSAPHTLTELLPVMQNMGLVVVDQKPYEFKPEDGEDYGYPSELWGSVPRWRGCKRCGFPLRGRPERLPAR